ncbi:FHA domain-containing protein [Pelosinus propionicus]|uniref:FHA domain-containing protein n=1 Tax=Pelosinus propionicus TaxID=380084 RepID=UPI001FDF2B7B|nr:FHA domain-containing protein [Pelosinus propionicus]
MERGEPYEAGSRIELPNGKLYLGRSSLDSQADVSFSNQLISRKHCYILQNEEDIILYDLGSKHGTMINGKAITPHEKYILNRGDTVSLSMGIAVIRIVSASKNEETMDLSQTQFISLKKDAIIAVDCAKLECHIDGQLVNLTEKEWRFFKLLYDHANTVVTYDAIRAAVWPERILGESTLPDAGVDEINVLIYRVRKKMGKRADMLKAMRARGYVMNL